MSFDLVTKYMRGMCVWYLMSLSAYSKGVIASQYQFYFRWNKIKGKTNQPELEDAFELKHWHRLGNGNS